MLLKKIFRFFIPQKNRIFIPIIFYLIILFLVYLFFPMSKSALNPAFHTIRVLDRNQNLLMELTPGQIGISKPVSLNLVPEDLLKLLIYSEDRDFYHHPGISVKGIARSFLMNFQSKKTVSGGSTLTQQWVKARSGITRNNIFTKTAEIFKALRLERHFTKKEILQAYVNQISFGSRVNGFAEAAEIFFNKNLSSLNLLEKASLIVILKSPSVYNPYQHPLEVQEKARQLLLSAFSNPSSGITADAADIKLFTEMPVYFRKNSAEIHAPHFALWAYEEAQKYMPKGVLPDEIITTLDLDWYNRILDIMQNRMEILKKNNAKNASLLLSDNKTGEILVWIGSPDFFDDKGQIDGVTIRRQPGSTMKPFNYALALESGRFTLSSILPDIYSQFPAMSGKYTPRDYSESFHGPVRLAEALGSSYNVPAVYVLNQMGLYPYYQFLKRAGFDSLEKNPAFYGLGLTLGNADTSLFELTQAYTVFPNHGSLISLKGILKIVASDGKEYIPPTQPKISMLKPDTALLINYCLSRHDYKIPAFGFNSPLNMPFPVAVKTGTSKDYNDNTIVGYTPKYTMGVWVGNLYNEPMKKLPSSLGAGIILRDVYLEMYNRGLDFPAFNLESSQIEKVKICKLSGELAGPYCPETDNEIFLKGTAPQNSCGWHSKNRTVYPEIYRSWLAENHNMQNVNIISDIKINHPQNSDIFKIEPALPSKAQKIPLDAVSRFQGINWYMDGQYLGTGESLFWTLKPGRHHLKAAVRSGTNRYEDSLSFFVAE